MKFRANFNRTSWSNSTATRIRLQNSYEEAYSNIALSDLRAVENIDSVAKTSTFASDNAFEERNDVRQVKWLRREIIEINGEMDDCLFYCN